MALIVNPFAGGGRAARVLPDVERRLRALGLPFTTHATRDLCDARRCAGAAARAGQLVVTLGGDGLLGCVAGALRAVPGATLGVLPGGRGNDFARSVGLPRNAAAACDVLAQGVPTDVDVGDANGTTFVGIASVGLDSEANRLANAAPGRLGRLAYVYGALRALAGWRHATFAVDVDGQRLRCSGWSVAAANASTYGGGMRLVPQARVDDGALDVVLIAATSRAHFVGMLPKVFRGTHVGASELRMLRGAEIAIDADRPLTLFADGEPVGPLPVRIRVVPAALKVMLPRR